MPKIIDEAKVIRDKIYNAFSNIRFIEESHQYFVKDSNGVEEEYNSVSHVIHKYNQPFDKFKISQRYAIKHGLSQEEVLRNWKYTNLCSTVSGTRNHLYGEGYTWLECGEYDRIPKDILNQYIEEEKWLIPTSSKEESVKKFFDELHETLYPIGAEFQMSSQYIKGINTKMCGTTDLLLYYKHPTDDSKSGVILSDWKTNKDLYSDYNREHNKMMLPPFDYLVDENFNHYSLQFGCYQLMLESIGVKIVGRRLIWLKDDGYEMLTVPSTTDALLKVL